MTPIEKNILEFSERVEGFNSRIQNALDYLISKTEKNVSLEELRVEIETLLKDHKITVKELSSYVITENISDREAMRKDIVEKLAVIDQELKSIFSTRKKSSTSNSDHDINSYCDFVYSLFMDQENEIYNFLAEIETSLYNEKRSSK